MPELSKIKIPGDNNTYTFKDEIARAAQVGSIIIRGSTTTALTDESTTNPITLNGDTYTAQSGDAVFYNKKEFVFDGTRWHEFGDMSGLGALAMKDSASGEYTPAGTVSKPTFSGTALTSTGKFTPTGSIQVNASSGSGTAYTPEGSISVNAASGSGTAYTPEGSVAAPTISLETAGTTASVVPFGSAGTLPSLSMTVANETLTITWSRGTLPAGGTAVTVKTGDGAYSASAPAFTGTQKKLAFSGTQKKLAFSGTQGNLSVSGTPEGTVTQPTFTGTPATITVS